MNYSENISSLSDEEENISIENLSIDESNDELSSLGDKYISDNEDEEEITTTKELEKEDIEDENIISDYLDDIYEVNESKIPETKIINYKNEKIDLTKVKNYKKNIEFNKMCNLEFISHACNITYLLKYGAIPTIPNKEVFDNYEYCNEETLAFITILKKSSGMFVEKEGKLYDISKYPIEDVIRCFKYYYKIVENIPFIIRSKILNDLFPNIIKNKLSNNITLEEIDETN